MMMAVGNMWSLTDVGNDLQTFGVHVNELERDDYWPECTMTPAFGPHLFRATATTGVEMDRE